MSDVVSVVSLCILFTLISGISASVDTALFKQRLTAARAIAVGLICQFVFLPLFGFASAKLFRLEDVFGITLILTTCSPGGAYSNWWCSLFNADLALSVAMTTCSTVTSMAIMPLNLFIYVNATYGASSALDWSKLLLSLGIALSAITVGLLVGYLRPEWRNRCNVVGNLAGLSLIVFSLITSSRDEPIWDKDLRFYAAVSLPCASGLLLAFALAWLCKLEAPQRVAVTVETCYQNTGIALTLALSIFPHEQQSLAAGVPLFYGVVEVVLLPLFLLASWKLNQTYAPSKDRLDKVLLGNYQPGLHTAAKEVNNNDNPCITVVQDTAPLPTEIGDPLEELSATYSV